MAADPAGVVCSERRRNGGADGRRETGKKDGCAKVERNRTTEREHHMERRRQRDIRDEETKKHRGREVATTRVTGTLSPSKPFKKPCHSTNLKV